MEWWILNVGPTQYLFLQLSYTYKDLFAFTAVWESNDFKVCDLASIWSKLKEKKEANKKSIHIICLVAKRPYFDDHSVILNSIRKCSFTEFQAADHFNTTFFYKLF